MNGKKITRRKFITVTSLGAAGAWVGLQRGLALAMRGSGGGGMGGGGDGTLSGECLLEAVFHFQP